MRNLKITVIIVALIALVLAMGAGCAKKDKPPKGQATSPAAVAAKEPTVYYWPYTGKPTLSKKHLNRRPLCVKIENSQAAMMQEGINKADIVYETEVEGDFTRFNCIFQSKIPNEVGPVRSARLSDLWVVPQYNGLLFFSGGNSQVVGDIAAAGLSNMSQDVAPSLYHRVTYKPAPHNLYLDLSQGYKYASETKKYKIHSKHVTPLKYDPAMQAADKAKLLASLSTQGGVTAPSPGGITVYALTGPAATGAAATGSAATGAATTGAATTGAATTGAAASAAKPATTIDWNIGSYNSAEWKWDPQHGVYLRSSLGQKHIDVADNKQLHTTNLVILTAKYTMQSMKDPAGNPTYDTQLGGTGAAIVFKDGTQIDGTWKADRKHPPKLFDEQGNTIYLNPGKTWFTVFDNRATVSVK